MLWKKAFPHAVTVRALKPVPLSGQSSPIVRQPCKIWPEDSFSLPRSFSGSGLPHLLVDQCLFVLGQPEKRRILSGSICNKRHLSFCVVGVWGYVPEYIFVPELSGVMKMKFRILLREKIRKQFILV